MTTTTTEKSIIIPLMWMIRLSKDKVNNNDNIKDNNNYIGGN